MTNKRITIFTAIIPFIFVVISAIFFLLSILFKNNNWNPIYVEFFYMSSTVIYSFCWIIADITAIISMGLALAEIKTYKVKALPEIILAIASLAVACIWSIMFFRPFFLNQ